MSEYNNKEFISTENVMIENNFLDTIIPANNYAIKFPKDGINTFENFADTISIVNYSGDSIEVTIVDEFFATSTTEYCNKVIRTYRVKNWNEYDGEMFPLVISRDENCNEESGEEDIWLIVQTDSIGNKIVYLDRDSLVNNTNPVIGTNRCEGGVFPVGHWANSTINTELTSIGYWQYSQLVIYIDTTAPEILHNDFEYEFVLNADCEWIGNLDVLVQSENSFEGWLPFFEVYFDLGNDGVLDAGTSLVAIDTLADGLFKFSITHSPPAGVHAYLIWAEDYCGNIDTVRFEVLVDDSGYWQFDGQIKSWEDVELEDVSVSNIGAENIRTDELGQFQICVDSITGGVTIAPFFNENTSNGISGLDLLRISKHILGT